MDTKERLDMGRQSFTSSLSNQKLLNGGIMVAYFKHNGITDSASDIFITEIISARNLSTHFLKSQIGSGWAKELFHQK